MPFGVAGGFFCPKFFGFEVSFLDDRRSRVDDRTSLVCMIGVGMAGVVLSYRVMFTTLRLARYVYDTSFVSYRRRHGGHGNTLT